MQDDTRGSWAEPSGPDPKQSTEAIQTAAHHAKDAVKTAVHDAADKVRQAGSDAKEKGADKVDAATDGAAEALRQVAEQLKGAVEGLGGDQPWAGKAFQTGADGLDRVSDYLATGKFDDFAKDIQTFAKTNPAAFLAGSVALGFMIARVGKTAAHHARDAAPSSGSQDDALPASAPTPVPSAPSGFGVGGLG